MMNGAGMCFLVAFLSLVPLSQSFLGRLRQLGSFLMMPFWKEFPAKYRAPSATIIFRKSARSIVSGDRRIIIWPPNISSIRPRNMDSSKLSSNVIPSEPGGSCFGCMAPEACPPGICDGLKDHLIKPYDQLISHSDSVPSAVASGSRSTKTEAEIIFVGPRRF